MNSVQTENDVLFSPDWIHYNQSTLNKALLCWHPLKSPLMNTLKGCKQPINIYETFCCLVFVESASMQCLKTAVISSSLKSQNLQICLPQPKFSCNIWLCNQMQINFIRLKYLSLQSLMMIEFDEPPRISYKLLEFLNFSHFSPRLS